MRLISEVPLGAFLSGALIRRLVVALMAEESSDPVKTFSIGFEEQDFSELKYARKVAEHVGAEYNEFIVRPNAMDVLADAWSSTMASPMRIRPRYQRTTFRRRRGNT